MRRDGFHPEIYIYLYVHAISRQGRKRYQIENISCLLTVQITRATCSRTRSDVGPIILASPGNSATDVYIKLIVKCACILLKSPLL